MDLMGVFFLRGHSEVFNFWKGRFLVGNGVNGV